MKQASNVNNSEDDSRSIIFFSTQTSATGSQLRVIQNICHPRYRREMWLEKFHKEGRIREIQFEIPPENGLLILHNSPTLFNKEITLHKYRFILNARDPRDLVCNQFYWQFSHPKDNESPEERSRRHEKAALEGIDAFALRHDNTPVLRSFFDVVRRINPSDRIFTGYAMYCLYFDEITKKISQFLGVDPSGWTDAQRALMERENSGGAIGNPKWRGHPLDGADPSPGRHKLELKPETVEILNQRYAWFLTFLQRMDDPRVAHTYD